MARRAAGIVGKPQHLHTVTASVEEEKEIARLYLLPQLSLHDSGQSLDARF
jgi:hypothetical protein